VTRLPRTLDDIHGLRVARWIRESTTGQFDRFGPASQREQQDRFIERHGLADTGLTFQVAHSGRTVWRSPTMTEMLVEARAGAFDLLLAGYSDRWQRNLRRTLELLEDGLHPVGVALVMCDRRILSSDPHDWDELVAEAAGAERYSRRLSERITDGYAAKFDHQDDPGGHAALGFRRLPERPHTLEIDPATIGVAVGLFERYALGTVSSKQLAAETGLADSRIRMILMNPLYNGWIRRHRGPGETRRPAAWRSRPPVSDDLWARVEDVRRARTQGGGPRHRGRLDLLAGLLECTCGRRIRSDGQMGASDRVAKLHTEPCAAWGSKARLAASTWEVPVLAQLGSLRVDNAVRAQITAVLAAGDRPATMDRVRLERQMRELALEHAAARLDDAEYLARMARLRGELEIVGAQPARDLPARRATEWLDALAESWQKTELVEEKSDVIHAVYERIVIEGPRFVGLRLTPAAYRHGLALALPEAVMARPTGVGRALTAYRMPIEGRDEWIAAVERLA
jgi:DNA invertase Pin-like site-specific DNA recombinase